MTACDSCCQGCHPISSWWFRHFGDRWNRHNLSRIRCRGRRKQLPVECTPSILFSLKGEIAWREAAPCCFVESFDLHFLVGMTGSGKTASFLLPMLERLCLDSQITDTAWQQRFKLCRPAIWVLSCLIYHWYILRYLYTRIFILLENFFSRVTWRVKKESFLESDVVWCGLFLEIVRPKQQCARTATRCSRAIDFRLEAVTQRHHIHNNEKTTAENGNGKTTQRIHRYS